MLFFQSSWVPKKLARQGIEQFCPPSSNGDLCLLFWINPSATVFSLRTVRSTQQVIRLDCPSCAMSEHTVFGYFTFLLLKPFRKSSKIDNSQRDFSKRIFSVRPFHRDILDTTVQRDILSVQKDYFRNLDRMICSERSVQLRFFNWDISRGRDHRDKPEISVTSDVFSDLFIWPVQRDLSRDICPTRSFWNYLYREICPSRCV